jgi:hypothetical protein
VETWRRCRLCLKALPQASIKRHQPPRSSATNPLDQAPPTPSIKRHQPPRSSFTNPLDQAPIKRPTTLFMKWAE